MATRKQRKEPERQTEDVCTLTQEESHRNQTKDVASLRCSTARQH